MVGESASELEDSLHEKRNEAGSLGGAGRSGVPDSGRGTDRVVVGVVEVADDPFAEPVVPDMPSGLITLDEVAKDCGKRVGEVLRLLRGKPGRVTGLTEWAPGKWGVRADWWEGEKGRT